MRFAVPEKRLSRCKRNRIVTVPDAKITPIGIKQGQKEGQKSLVYCSIPHLFTE